MRQEYPQPNDVEYYYNDKHDQALKSRVDKDYLENYEQEVKKAQTTNTNVPDPFRAYLPELRDYTLKDEFRDPFKTLPQVSRTSVS